MVKKLTSLILCVLMLFAAAGSVFSAGMVTESHVQLVHVAGNAVKRQVTSFHKTLADAVKAAQSGDIIEVFEDITSDFTVAVPADTELIIISAEKRKNDINIGEEIFEKTVPSAAPKTVTKNFDGSLFALGENSRVTFENIVLDGNKKGGLKGGIIYAASGAAATLRGVTLKNGTLGENSFGGAIYAGKNSSVSIESAVFSGNSAAVGKDIYAEQKTDVSVSGGTTADFGYPEEKGVEISGLNLVLADKVGLTFHTFVPDKYLDGSFVMTARTRESITLKIADCPKDEIGRYTATYYINFCELSEPVTLTVLDKNGAPLVTKDKSAEDYGKWLLENSASEKEKAAVRAILNCGHFIQEECAGYGEYEIGSVYAKTAKVADISTADGVFDGFTYTWTGSSPEIKKICVQLDCENDLLLLFPKGSKPIVLVDGAPAEATLSENPKYGYCVRIKDIGISDMAKVFTVKVNGSITLTLSAMSYCKLASEQNGKNCKNAVKALYELYSIVCEY